MRTAELDLGKCRIERTPVALEQYRDDWWLPGELADRL
jgi:hypothetical protein